MPNLHSNGKSILPVTRTNIYHLEKGCVLSSGGLVFDIADIIKDAIVMPQAFISAAQGDDAQAFRQRCIDNFQQTEALDTMIVTPQETASAIAGAGQ